LTPAGVGFIESRKSGLGLLKSTFNSISISYAGCLGLFLAISAQFTVKMFVAARNCEKVTKTSYFEGLRSFKVIDVDITKKLVAGACYEKQHVCACLQLFLR